MELGEVQAQLEEAQRLRSDAEERAAAAMRERSDIRTQLEENEEELAEVMYMRSSFTMPGILRRLQYM